MHLLDVHPVSGPGAQHDLGWVGEVRETHAAPVDYEELQEARRALECGMMPLVVARASDSDLDELAGILERERLHYERGESPAGDDIWETEGNWTVDSTESYENAIRIAPRDHKVLNAYAIFLCKQGDF